MRNTTINSSIANVITRFCIKVTMVLRASNHVLLLLWRLDPCAGSLSRWHSGTNFMFRKMSAVKPGSHGMYLPMLFLPSQKQPGNVVRYRQLFQRLS